MPMENHNYYILTQDFMYMSGYHDRNGRPCSLVKELGRTLIVEKSPIEILDESIKCIGFNLKGALSSSKWILGDCHMRPLMVNPAHKLCVFPDKSPNSPNATWFNPYHIMRTSSINGGTKIEFRNGLLLKIPSRLTNFNHKLQTAEQFRNLTTEIASNPMSFVLDPRKRRLQIGNRI
ncbi:competence protein ComK [Bacillus sp. cl95]|nr:competence protein ComK [Bacillus sp. UNCCL13]SFQ88396.1 competence protein ComK [Bacillus sp. cl95]